MASESKRNTELDELIAEWLELVERGENPDAERFIEGCPDYRRDFLQFIHDENELQAVRAAAINETTFVADAATLRASSSDVIGGRYKLLELIAEGGMGAVWLAEQREPVRRKVAIKLIKLGMDSREILARFEAERQALALMEHENIARVFDGGITDSGRPYFAMEYVDGEPITQYCDRQELSLDARLDLFVLVCRAVQHAHQKGIVHRDLKPSNILVCPFDGRPVPKIIDFGLAKAMNQPLTEKTLFTGHGVMLGTPKYMSPEQAENNNLDIDTRTDVYSLGVLLYELLTGTTPLTTEQLQAVALQEIIRLIRELEPIRPSTRLTSSAALPAIAAKRRIEPHRLTKSLTGDLDWIALKALAKERDRRYETASDLARDIERFLTNDAVEARPPSPAYQLQKFVRRNRGKVAAFAFVIVSLVAGIVVSTLSAIEVSRARDAESRSHAKFVRQVTKTHEQEQRALRQEAETRVARASEASSRFFQLVEIARREVNSHRAGWKKRATDAIGSAHDLAGFVVRGQQQLRSLAAATNVRLDIGEPLFTFSRRGVRNVAFHPRKDWLFVSTRRAYLPDPLCHIYVLQATSGEILHDIGLLNSLYPAFNGIEGLLLSPDGRWLHAITASSEETSNVLVFDTEILPETRTPVRKFEVPIRKLHQWLYADSSDTLVICGRETGPRGGEKFGDYVLLSVDAETGQIGRSVKSTQPRILVGSLPDNSLLVGFPSVQLQLLDPVSFETREVISEISADNYALFQRSLAVPGIDSLSVFDIGQRREAFAYAETPSAGWPEKANSAAPEFSSQGRLLSVGDSANKRLHFWSGSDLRYAVDLGVPGSNRTLRYSVSSDERLLATSQGETVSVRGIQHSSITSFGLSSSGIAEVAYDDLTGSLVGLRPLQPHRNPGVEMHRWNLAAGAHPKFVKNDLIPMMPWVPEPGLRLAQNNGRLAILRGHSTDDSPHEATVSISGGEDWNDLMHVEQPDLISFRSDGELVVGSQRGTLRGISTETGEVLRQWRRIEDLATGGGSQYTTVTHLDELLIVTDDQGYCTLVSWNTSLPKQLKAVRISSAPVKAVACDKDRRILICGDYDGTISLLDTADLRLIHQIEQAHHGPIHALAVFDDGQFVTGGQDRKVAFWNLEDRKVVLDFEFEVGTPVRRLFAAPSRDSVIMVRDRCASFEEIPYQDLQDLNLGKSQRIETDARTALFRRLGEHLVHE